MLWRTTFILFLLGVSICPAQKSDEPTLPTGLNEPEKQMISKEQTAKPRVEAALKISDARLADALRLAADGQAKPASQELVLYAALIIYADAYARRLPASQHKELNACLKRLEQTIFKQNRALEAALRDLPVDYRDELQAAIGDVKKIRIKALNDLLGSGYMLNSSN